MVTTGDNKTVMKYTSGLMLVPFGKASKINGYVRLLRLVFALTAVWWNLNENVNSWIGLINVLKYFDNHQIIYYGSAEGPPRGVENRNLLSHPDDLRMEAYVIRMT